MRRRSVLLSVAVVVPLSGCSRAESGNIQIANQTDQPVWKTITVRREGGLLSDAATVYDRRTKTPPTAGYRSTLTDVAPPGRYEVTVKFEATDTAQESGTQTTQWSPTGEPSESLIVTLTPDFSIEFHTQ